MIRKWLVLGMFVCTACALFGAGDAFAENHRLGAGVNYWVTLDDLDIDEADEDGLSYLLTYQYQPGLLGVELDLEFLPDRFGEDAYAPQAYLLLGTALYGGAGIGIIHTDGSFEDEPFFALKAGLDLELLPRLYLDVSANYRFNDTADLEDSDSNIDTDTVFLGAAVRLEL